MAQKLNDDEKVLAVEMAFMFFTFIMIFLLFMADVSTDIYLAVKERELHATKCYIYKRWQECPEWMDYNVTEINKCLNTSNTLKTNIPIPKGIQT